MPQFQIHSTLSKIPAVQWDALHDGSNPFVAHTFLSGLEQHGSLRPDWGWTPHHLTLWDGDALLAAAPGYLKGNSHGEFVFDHAWASALSRAGFDYYPKWLFAVPYTPASGPRLLARGAQARALLCAGILEAAKQQQLPSIHVNFLTSAESSDCPAEWLERNDVQFHWRNDAGWQTFDDYLGALQSKKRKNIRHEREQVQAANVGFRIVHGDEASSVDIVDMHTLYVRAFADKGNSPALTLGFLQHLALSMPRSLVLILAQRDGKTIAGALCLRGGETLYGRYWGAFEDVPGLHFETCYYQGIDYCLREGLRVFEPGAQGEHKIARGFLPVITRSRHHFLIPGVNDALANWCKQECESNQRYRDAVLAHSPFRTDV